MKTQDCMDGMPGCKTTGYLSDLMGFLQTMYNFTWQSTNDPNGDWGVVPLSGPPNANGTWGGVVGSLVEQTAQMSVSAWLVTPDRLSLLDYAQIHPEGNIIAC